MCLGGYIIAVVLTTGGEQFGQSLLGGFLLGFGYGIFTD